jgi:drug/metabolite transporter (DMT)-like permease
MIYLWLVSFLWAFSFGIIKDTLSGLDANFVALARLVLAALVFLPLLRLRQCAVSLRWQLAAIGAFQFGLMYVAYIASFRYLKAYEVALFTVFTPLYVTLFADALQQRRPDGQPRFHPRFLLAALLAVAGSLVASYKGGVRPDFWLGFGLVQVSNLAFAFGQVAYRIVMSGRRPLVTGGQSQAAAQPLRDQDVFGWLYLGGAGLAAVAALLFTNWGALAVQPAQWLALLYLGCLASGLGFFLWNKGARQVNSGVLAVFNNLKAPLAVAVSLLVFGEQADPLPLLLGGGILLAALFLAGKKG